MTAVSTGDSQGPDNIEKPISSSSHIGSGSKSVPAKTGLFAQRGHADLSSTLLTMRSFLQFGILSGGGWLLDCGLLLLLSQRLGVDLSVANVISSSTAALTVFTVSRLLIFNPVIERQFARTLMYACYTFGVIAAASAVIEPIVWWSYRVAQHFAISLTAGQVSFIGKILVTPPQLLANFYIARYLAQLKI